MNGEIEIETVTITDRTVKLRFGNETCIQFEDCWLRDHCRCPVCYHADTFQRAQHILDIPDSKIVDIDYDKQQLRITWDDDHKSVFNADFLLQFDHTPWTEARRLKPVLWRGAEVSKRVARIRVDKFLGSEAGLRAVFQSLLDYGIALIEGVEPTTEATEKVCVTLGGVQHTIFGGMWEFTTRADHADTAYTNLPLAAHNDNTYFTEAAGLQVLHCLEHTNGAGGDTILVDGFYGASRLKVEHPEDYQFLTTFNLEAEYIEEGHHHSYAAPVITLHQNTKDLKQIRFNVYDRAPMAFANGEECRAYYGSLRNLARYYEDTDNQWRLKLKPGTVLAMDNFRVLHGRTAFSGTRVLSGCYVARSDWLDKARALRLVR